MTNETNTNPKTTKHRRWIRFRLRTLLVIVTVLTVPFGWVGWELDQRRREKATIAWVEEMGGQVYFSSLFTNDERSWWKKKKDNWFGKMVCMVSFDGSQVSDLSPLAKLKNLEYLDLDGTQAFFLDDTQVSDLSPLAELKNLHALLLYNTQVTDLSPLTELKNLESLLLSRRLVGDEQVQELKLALPNCEIILRSTDR